MAITGVLNTLVTADSTPFDRSLSQASKKAGQFRTDVEGHAGGLLASMRKLFDVAGGGGVSGLFTSIAASGSSAFDAIIGIGEAAGVTLGTVVALTVAVAALGAGLLYMGSKGAESIQAMGTLSRQVGISVQDLSVMRAMPGMSDSDTFARSIIHMQRAIAEGSPDVARSLSLMGLSLQELQRTPDIRQVDAIYAAWSRLPDQAERSRAAMALFSRGGITMMDSLARGSEGLNAARERARRFGLEITQVEADTVRRSEREWGNLGLTMRGISEIAAVAFAPLWEEIGIGAGGLGASLVGAFQKAMPYIHVTSALIGATIGGMLDVIGGVIDGVTELFRSLENQMSGARDPVLEFFAVFTVSMRNLRGEWGTLFTYIRLGWLELRRWMGEGGLDQEIDNLREQLNAFGADFRAQVQAQVNTWRQLFSGGVQSAGGTASTFKVDTKAITGHEAALMGGERAYSILNNSGNTLEQLARQQLYINTQTRDYNRQVAEAMRQAALLRRIRR